MKQVSIDVAVYHSPEDGAIVIELDTSFEPDGSDGVTPGLRVWLNDGDIFAGKEAPSESIGNDAHVADDTQFHHFLFPPQE